MNFRETIAATALLRRVMALRISGFEFLPETQTVSHIRDTLLR